MAPNFPSQIFNLNILSKNDIIELCENDIFGEKLIEMLVSEEDSHEMLPEIKF